MNRSNNDNVGGGIAVVHRGGNPSLSMNMRSSLPLPPPPSPPSPRRRKSNHTMASNQKKKFLHQTRVDMTGNLEHVPSSEEDEHTAFHQDSPPKIERPNSRLDTPPPPPPPPHSPSSPSASLSKLSSVEVRLAKLLKEHPNNDRALLLQKKINDRKAQATKRQQKVQNHLDVQDPYKSAESLGSMTRLDIHGLYFKNGKGDETNGGNSTSSSSSSSSSSPPSSPSSQRKRPIQTVSKLSPTTSRNQFGNNQSILRSGRYNSTTDDGNKTALLGLIDSIELKYNNNNNNNNDPSSPIQKLRTKQPKKSKSWAGTNTDTVEHGRNNRQHDGPEGRSRSRSKRARSTSRSRKSRSKSKTRSRSKSASRKKKGEVGTTDDKQSNSNSNKNPKYRRSRSLPPGPVDDVQDDLPRAASFHQQRYPPHSSSSFASRNSNGSYITDTRSVGADGSSSFYDGYDDSTVGSFHQHRRLQPKNWRLPLSSSPPEGLQSYKAATWMLVVCLLIVGLVILILWIVGVIEI